MSIAPRYRDAMTATVLDLQRLGTEIKQLATQLGFQQVGIAHLELAAEEAQLASWLAAGFHGEMDYMQKHGSKRTRPAELVNGTVAVISASMNYWPAGARDADETLNDPQSAYISRYALGRDYHKVLRGRLRQLSLQIEARIGPFGYRVFTDSAPVLEKPLARSAGLGWLGKHTNLINREDGSWFFLGEIYTDLPLPPDPPHDRDHCGTCVRCIEVCPTRAIVAPYVLDARRCIAYLTIELKGTIPREYRAMIGNRIFGCDDCQLVCPWNRFAKFSAEPDFRVRHALDRQTLLELFAWDEAIFLQRTEGSALRRIGFEQWQRNLAVALGNAPPDSIVAAALQHALPSATPLVQEHIAWALTRQQATRSA